MAQSNYQSFSFTNGEISPESLGGSNSELWPLSLETCRNWITKPQGPAFNRPGTEFVGYEYRRREFPIKTYSASDTGNPVILTDTTHGNTTGDVVVIQTCVGGAFELTGIEAEIRVIDADTFYLLGHDASADTASHSGNYYVVPASQRVREVPFQFNTDDTYMLYFGDQWMMPARDGGLVLESTGGTFTTGDVTYPATGEPMRITQATPVDHGLWEDDEVHLDDFANDAIAKDHGNKRYRVLVTKEAAKTVSAVQLLDGFAEGILAVLVTTSTTHGYFSGQRVFFESLGGMTELNDQWYAVEITSPTLFILKDRNGSYVDARGFTAYTTGGTSKAIDITQFDLEGTGGNTSATVTISGTLNFYRYFRLETPWTSSQLADIDYSQNFDTVTITHSTKLHQITRTAHDAWTVSDLDFEPGIAPPLNIATTVTGTTVQAAVTTVSKSTGEESLPNRFWVGGTTMTLSWDSVDDAFEYNVYRTSTGFNHGAVDVAERTAFELDPTGAHTTSIRPPEHKNPFEVAGSKVTITGSPGITLAQPAAVTAPGHDFVIGDRAIITNVDTMVEINDRSFTIESVTGDVVELLYSDSTGHTAYTGTSGRIARLSATDLPTAVAHFQSRLDFANTTLFPQAIWMTTSGSLESMQTHTPQINSDAISLEIADEGDNIRWLVPMQDLIALTAGSAYAIVGNANGVLTPSETSAVSQYAGGASTCKPVKVGAAIVYVADVGSSILELTNASDTGSASVYVPRPISLFAQHLLEGFTIEEMASAPAPYNLVWGIRSDGVLIGCTYLREFNIAGWHRHDTVGNFESVGAIRESNASATYLSVKRTLGGITRRFFERIHNREYDDLRDAHFVDCGLKYEEKYAATADFVNTTPLRLEVGAAHGFVEDDYVDMEHRIDGQQTILEGFLNNNRYQVDAVASTTIDLKNLDGTDLDGSAIHDDTITTLNAYRCFTTAQFFDHFAGETIPVLTDGGYNGTKLVSAVGEITFDDPHSRVIAGEPIEADLKTLSPDVPAGPFASLHDTRFKTQSASIHALNTQGLKVGPSADSLHTINFRTDEGYGEPTDLQSGLEDIPISHEWGEGQLFVRQSDPLPATVLGLGIDLELEIEEEGG